jgi:Carboxypeptidase regulatory-like domain
MSYRSTSVRCAGQKFSIAPLLLVLMLAFAAGLFGQATGRIGGTVVDPSGGLVPGVSVVCRNTATGLARSADTNQAGIFEFPDLPIGTYQLEVTKQGFQKQVTDNVPLVTGQVVDMKITLRVGDVNQTVSVSSEAPLVESASSTVQTTVTQSLMQDLPLNGRNPLQLTTLTPGTVMTDVGTEATQQDNRGIAVNGLRATMNNFQLDGTIYTNRFFDSVPTMPSPDALQEFTIQSSNYSAEYGGAGALVQLSTRSGSNQLHGSAFEFLRNTDLNARNFFALKRPPFKLNQFGGTIGGPIKKNNTFFFFSAQDLQQRSAPNPVSLTVPSAANRNGDFSNLLPGKVITDPSNNNLPFSNNVIPPSRLDQVALKIQDAYIPLPNSGNLYVTNQNKNVDDTQYLVKVDHNFTDKNHFSGRYFYDQYNFQRPFTAPLGFFSLNLFRNQSVTLNDTHTFAPTLTATFFASMGRFSRTQIPQAPGLKTLQDFGQNVPLGTGVSIFPGIRVHLTSFFDLFSGGALKQNPTSYVYKASAIKSAGAHTINFGAEFERTGVNANDYSYTPGDNTFNGQRTGYTLSDFLLGLPSQFYQDNGRSFYIRENRFAAYFNDDWRVNRKLTLNLGVRWEPWLPPIDKNNTLVGFVPGMQSVIAPNAPKGLVYPGDSGIVESVFKHNWKDFAPRVGFAYDIGGNGKTVVRAAYGIFYSFPEGLLYQRTDAMQPICLYYSIPNPISFVDPYQNVPGGDPFPRPKLTVDQFKNYSYILPVSGGVLDPASNVGYTQNWNFTFERQLRSDMAISVAYVGNHALNIMGSRQFNPAILAPGATVANENQRRLYPGLGAVELASSYVYDNFNSLQIGFTKRLARGFTVLSNFVWSKTIDNNSSAAEGNAGPPNPFNFRSARGPADFDQAARFNLSAAYAVPDLNLHGVANVLLNHWNVNLITTLDSGMPVTVVSGTDRSLSGVGNDYADIVGDPSRPAGADPLFQYFNKSAFQAAALGTFGTVGRGTIRGPGYFNVDASLFKEFHFSERWRLQFRAEVFNFENRANFNNPVASVASGTFGRITAAYDPRVLQFALKLFF